MKTIHTTNLIDAAAEFFAPLPDLAVWEWAEQNVFLPQTEAQVPGPYSTDLVPFVREPMEAVCRMPNVIDVTLMWAAQTTKTTMLNVTKLYDIANQPRNILNVMPSIDLARSFSETRWLPLVHACPPVADLIPSDRHAIKNLEQNFTNMLMTFVGSNSPANLASRPVPRIDQDETDKFKEATTKEASADKLADHRCKTFANPSKNKTSTPTTESGIIYREFIKGDQREYFTPCPNCGEYIMLLMEQIKWPQELKTTDGWDFDAVKRSTYYECQECGFHINDGHKTKMNRAGEWRPQNIHAPSSHRSYHLTSWQAPWASCTFGATAVKYLNAMKEFTIQDFDNSERGWPSRVEAQKMDWEILAARRETYNQGQIPLLDVALLTAFVDVQGDWLEFFLWGWGEGTENWLIEHEMLHGDPSAPQVWEALTETLSRTRDLPIDWIFIDYGGHHGQEAIEYAKKMGTRKVFLHKGSTIESDPVNGRVTWTKKPRTRLYFTGVGNGKRSCLSMMKTDAAGPGYCHYPSNIDDEFFKQLCSEELRTKYKHGAPTEYWHQTRKRNEAIDGFVGAYAGLKRLNQGIIKRRIAELTARRKADAEPAVPAPNEPVRAGLVPTPPAPPSKKKSPNRRPNPRGWMNQ